MEFRPTLGSGLRLPCLVLSATLSAFLILSCSTESALDSAQADATPTRVIIQQRGGARAVPVPEPRQQLVALGGKFESPHQYGQFPSTQQAAGPLSVMARNPYLNDVNADATAVPMVSNAAGSAVYPPEVGGVSHYENDSPAPLASGSYYSENSLTAAHKTLPFGTIVKCTRMDTGESVVVMINDRGPYVRGRVLDLNSGAARRINLAGPGVAPCKIEVLAYPLIETMGPHGNG